MSVGTLSPRRRPIGETPPTGMPSPPGAQGHIARDALSSRLTGLAALAGLTTCLSVVFALVASQRGVFLASPVIGGYFLVIVAYNAVRYLSGIAYLPRKRNDHEPRVAVVVPVFNEERAIAGTIESLLDVDYPRAKLQLVVVDDGSTDDSLAEIMRVADAHQDVVVVSLRENRGKVGAMVAGIGVTDAEILVFVDSDSQVARDGIRAIVQDFADPRVGAVCGNVAVSNLADGFLPKVQALQYYSSFHAVKATESLLGTVTCCSGCFSAYRRAAIEHGLSDWQHETVLGISSSLGDDRALTNVVLKNGWRVTYEERARSWTITPKDWRTYIRQQNRWKRSWVRESLVLVGIVRRRNPLTALLACMELISTYVTPLAVAGSLVAFAVVGNLQALLLLLAGAYALSLAECCYFQFRERRRDKLWIYGIPATLISFLLSFAIYYVPFSMRAGWGTRTTAARP
ncbi:MAG: glycosyltransferase family 2 protein [Actinobacteria bacterium]|nr:glycosyltransferase family 2 protein [Actinomycetota bacterium]